jgi:hypothetical protein
MITASAHTSTATTLLDLLAGYWWLILIFGGTALEFIGETFDVGLRGLRRRSKLRHKRRVELKRLELQILQAKQGALPASLPKPGRCVHRHVTAVISTADDELRGWLCKSCDTQLPPDWAVREEDL